MAVIPKKMYGGTLSTTLTTPLYEVPSSTTAVVTGVTVCNSSGSAADITLKFDGVAFYSATPVPNGETWTVGPNDIRVVLDAGDTITGGSSAGSALEVTVSGVEKS
jgi:hypothetical protein